MVFSSTAASLAQQTAMMQNSIMATPTFWSLVLSCVMIVPLLQKELREIKSLSIILFAGIGLFIVLVTHDLIVNGPSLNPDQSYKGYLQVKRSQETISALGIILVAYGFHQNLFPIANSLTDST